MPSFTLHPQLQADCHVLGWLLDCQLLLHRNPLLPWYILVPQTDAGELHQLDATQRREVDRAMDALARFVLAHHLCERTNVAAIGNRVPQLHIHVVGRWSGDPCWPDVVWGNLPDAGERRPGDLEMLWQALTGLPGFVPVSVGTV
ncbi:MAG: HIT family protein [Oleiphilaceae bacterium]|nr:HIT family protein [Oleiphilaceae bacterium]